MPIRAVVFDLFDTLVDLRFEDVELLELDGMRLPASLRLLHAELAEHSDIDFEAFVRASVALDAEFRKTHYANDRELPTLERFTALAAHLGLEDQALPGSLTRLHMGHLREHVAVPAHHASLLGSLSGQVRLGLCSNFSHTPTALEILEEADLLPRLATVVISDAVGIRKPAAEIFDAVLGGLNVRPEETLHVGDSLRADVGGAAARGIRTAWITRRVSDPGRRLREHQGPAPDFVIHDLAELSALVEENATDRAWTHAADSGKRRRNP